MKKFITCLSLCFLLTVFRLKGQSPEGFNTWMDYLEEMAVEGEDEERIETLYTELTRLTADPMDINDVLESDLRKLPFLSDQQIREILSYRKKYGRMQSIYELKNVKNLDFNTISMLLPFVYVGETKKEAVPFTWKNLLSKGKNELYIRFDQCLQRKKGYRPQSDSILEKYPNRKYLGESFYHSIRYAYEFEDHLQFGIIAEKNAGEPFWNGTHKGYDYYSAHLVLKDLGILKTLALGDYKISFGQGLVISTDASNWKNGMITHPEKGTNGFRRHYSTDETNFFRGAGATFKLKNMELSLFYSARKMDATVDSNRITSMKTDGLHRLVREREKQDVFTMHTFGGNLRYYTPRLTIGLTAIRYDYGDLRMEPGERPYNRYYFRGNKNFNGSIDYSWRNRYLLFYGETALSENGGMATLNGLQFTPFSDLTIMLIYRNYSKHYQSYYGSSFSQNTSIQNEEGFYGGIQYIPFANWKITTYVDLFRFPWLKYRVDEPSKGIEYRFQADYNDLKKTAFLFSYSYRRKKQNLRREGEEINEVLPYSQHRLRGQISYLFSKYFSMKTSAEGSFYKDTDKELSTGWILSQNLSFTPRSVPLHFDLFLAYFQSDDYQSRVYAREKSLPYAFSLPSFYGKGTRFSAIVNWDIVKKLRFSVKIAWAHYFNRDVIGSDLEEIDGHDKVDLNTSLQWKF